MSRRFGLVTVAALAAIVITAPASAEYIDLSTEATTCVIAKANLSVASDHFIEVMNGINRLKSHGELPGAIAAQHELLRAVHAKLADAIAKAGHVCQMNRRKVDSIKTDFDQASVLLDRSIERSRARPERHRAHPHRTPKDLR